MGNVLILKKADFSDSSVALTDIFDLVKKNDAGDGSYPLSRQKWYNNIALPHKVKVYAIAFTLPDDVSALSASADSKLVVGATTDKSNIARSVIVDLSKIVNAAIDGTIEGGTTHIVALPSPLTINSGEYMFVGLYDDDNGNRMLVYARTPSGNFGYMQVLGSTSSVTSYNIAVDLYGEIDE